MAGEATAALELPVGITESKVLQQIARLESQLRKAQNDVQKRFVQSNQQIAKSFSPIAASAQGMSRSTVASLQNVSYQLQDIFVQIQGGQGAMRAFSQQMPQLLSGFGFAGAIAGLATALGASLIPMLISTTDEAEAAGDAVKNLEGAFKAYGEYVKTATADTADLIEKFGEFGGKIREVSAFMAEVSIGALISKAGESLAPIKGELAAMQELRASIAREQGRMDENVTGSPQWALAREHVVQYGDELARLSAKIGLTSEQALLLADKMDVAFNAQNPRAMADAALDVISTFEAMGVPLLSLPPALQETMGHMYRVAEASAQATVDMKELHNWIEQAKNAITDMWAGTPGSGWLAGEISDAMALARAFWEAARARAAAMPRSGAVPGQGPAFEKGGRMGDSHAPYVDQPTLDDLIERDKKKGGKRGGGGNKTDKEYNALLREREQLLNSLKTPAEKFADELAKIEKLQEKGLISKEEAEAAKKHLQDLQPVAQSVRSALQSAFDGVFDDPREALKNLAKEFAMLAVKMQLMKSLPGIFGSGGMIPLTLNATGGVYSGPGISSYSGKVVSKPTVFPFARGAGLMGEAGPEAILPLTRVNGRLGVRADGSGGGGTSFKIIDQRGAGAPAIETQSNRGPNGEELVTMVVKDQMARGAFNGPMRSRYGMQSQKVVR